MIRWWLTLLGAAGLVGVISYAPAIAQEPGRLVDIGGRALHVVETPGTGPVVVLEAGGGGFSSHWHNIQSRIRDDLGLRAISYDRAGLGWSEPAPVPYRILDRADDLNALLMALDIDTPIVLVGQSYGGWVAQAFTSTYPNRAGALVLVDANSTYFFDRFPETVARIESDGRDEPARGLKRMGLRLQRNWFAKRVGTPRSAFEPLMTERHQLALGQMLSAFGETLEVLSAVQFPDIRTIVVTRGQAESRFPWGDSESEEAWRAGHEDMIEHLSDRHIWIAENAGHAVTVDQPQIVIDAISAALEGWSASD